MNINTKMALVSLLSSIAVVSGCESSSSKNKHENVVQNAVNTHTSKNSSQSSDASAKKHQSCPLALHQGCSWWED
ncbi:hypothetical protein [Candidatus Liberibacter brunswickensis]|uniref:hypothetical protein n=1 Tax=Candidatus Liberibacter brunswickensis TaxID=1968796 RepID=UPI002FE18F7F